MPDPIKPTPPAPQVPDKTPQAAPVAGSLQGHNPNAPVTPTVSGQPHVAPSSSLGTPGLAPDPHVPGKFLSASMTESEKAADTLARQRKTNESDEEFKKRIAALDDTRAKMAFVKEPESLQVRNDRERKRYEQELKDKDLTEDPVTGIRTHNKTGKRTSRVVSSLTVKGGSLVARQYVGTGPLNVHTPGGEVKAYSGDFILTFDEPQWEIVDAEYVKVMDKLTKKQKLKQTNLVISKEQMAILDWAVVYEEFEVAPDKPL